MSGPPTVAEALEHCRCVTRRRARNFYYGLKLTPEPQRSALYSVYAWMRRADDLVDGDAGGPEGRRGKIERFRAATESALAGRAADNDPLWIALADTAAQFDLDRNAMATMLEGQIEDLAEPIYDTFQQVREYCYRVASTVGLVCISVWGYDDPVARDLAVDRGIAFQLTNILRDYKEDFDGGRVYLPLEDFTRHGITPKCLRGWEEPDPCRRFVLQQVARAKSYYRRSAALDGMITPACRPTLWAMTTIYGGLLRKIERLPRRIVADQRLRLRSWQKGAIALRARRQAARTTPETSRAYS